MLDNGTQVAVRLSESCSGIHFCLNPRVIMRMEGLGKMKKLNDLIGKKPRPSGL